MSKETRNEKFRRIAENRMSRILTNMDLISNLTNKQRYEYTKDEINELIGAYKKKGEEIQKYFEETPPENKPTKTDFVFKTKITYKTDKNNNFRRIAENRMSKIFKDMNLMANLSTKTNYTYSIQEIDELFNAYYEKGIGIRERFYPQVQFKFTER